FIRWKYGCSPSQASLPVNPPLVWQTIVWIVGARTSRRDRQPLEDLQIILHGVSHDTQSLIHQGENRAVLKFALVVARARRPAGQNFNALLDFFYRPNVEFAGRYSIQNIFAEHQVFNVGGGDHHALAAGQPLDTADTEISFNFFVHSADGLNVTLLIHRAGHRDVLPQR